MEENFPETRPSALARTILELYAVEMGVPTPARHRIGEAEFLRCGAIAFDEGGAPVEKAISARKKRIARAVAEAFRAE